MEKKGGAGSVEKVKQDFFSKAAEIVGKGYAKISEESVNTVEN